MGNRKMKFHTVKIIRHEKGLYKKSVEVLHLEPSNVRQTSFWASLGVTFLGGRIWIVRMKVIVHLHWCKDYDLQSI